MKVGAHPLVVAVALGLVGPQVLEEAEPVDDAQPCAGCDQTADPVSDAAPQVDLDELSGTIVTTRLEPSPDWTRAEAPSPEDFARIAEAFEKARNLV